MLPFYGLGDTCAISSTAGINYLKAPVISILCCPLPIEIYAPMAILSAGNFGVVPDMFGVVPDMLPGGFRYASGWSLICFGGSFRYAPGVVPDMFGGGWARWMRSQEEWGRVAEVP